MIREILQESSVAQGWWEEGQRELVRQAIEDRFGSLDPDEQAALAVADAGILRSIVAHLAVDSRGQLRSRLGLP